MHLVRSFDSAIRFPKKKSTAEGFEEVLARHEKSIIDSYRLTQTEDEIWVTEQVNNLMFQKNTRMESMHLVLASDLAEIREQYIDVIEHTKDMHMHARWIYGQHPTDAMLQSYIDRQEMYLFMDGQNVAGMIAVTMYQGEDYHEILWSQNLKDDEVASLHILVVAPGYQGKGVSKKMMEGIISLVRENGKKAIRLDVLASNVPAQRMYEKLEFEYRGKQNLYAENTGWTDFLYYELPLNKD